MYVRGRQGGGETRIDYRLARTRTGQAADDKSHGRGERVDGMMTMVLLFGFGGVSVCTKESLRSQVPEARRARWSLEGRAKITRIK